MSIRSISLAAASAAVLMIPAASSGAGCSVDKFKITARKHVSCTLAKTVTHRKVSGKKLPAGWHCSSGSGIIPEGKCSKGAMSFKYAM